MCRKPRFLHSTYNELLHTVNTKCNYEHFMYFSAEYGENLNATWNSTTPSVKALSHDREYFFLPYWDDKPTMWIRATFPDHRRRMYNSNTISKVVEKLVSAYMEDYYYFSFFFSTYIP